MTEPTDSALHLAAQCIADATEVIPALTAIADAQHALLTQAQHALARYLQPGGYSKRDVINRLLEILDGPEALEAGRLYAEMRGETE